MFTAGEEILRANPDGNPIMLAKKLREHFKTNGVQLSKVQDEMIDELSILLKNSIEKRHTHLQQIFDKAGKNMPTKLEDIQRMMNKDADVNFIVWSENFTSKIDISFTQKVNEMIKECKIPQNDIERLLLIAKNDTIDSLKEALKILYKWSNKVELDITSHPTAIFEKYATEIEYGSRNSVAHLAMKDGVMRI